MIWDCLEWIVFFLFVFLVLLFLDFYGLFKMHFSGDILQASDDLSHVINSYKKIVEGQTINGETEEAQQTRSSVRQGTF